MAFAEDKNDILNKIKSTDSLDNLEKIRLHYLGKKGLIPEALKGLGSLSIEEKKSKGQELNITKKIIEETVKEQKIIIARALYNKPKILIFDEATNALDPISEVKILKNIRKKFKGLTLIFVTHRLNSLRRCDKIIFLENSKVKKSGKFDKLLKTDKNFYSLITAYNN